MKIQIDDMLIAADEASNLLKALANRHRLIIICQLSEKARSVGELADLLKLRDSTVSQHLAILRKDGLVAARRDGQTIWYSISSTPARELVRTLNRVYCAPSGAAGNAGKELKQQRKNGAAKTTVKTPRRRAALAPHQ
jgi:DNA-binding transcriptional ArsR family regulator